ncbi:hypothetical protein RBY4I_927 [Rhodobacterales bacterium Y4I]|nr:hypothetical protein RBY4I_927 [Rhodobacterales bacterium Y4I]
MQRGAGPQRAAGALPGPTAGGGICDARTAGGSAAAAPEPAW